MAFNGLTEFIYRLSEWVMRLAYVNLLWILFTLMGLVVFGVFPATAGLFGIHRKWMKGDSDVPVFKTFWNMYRSEFIHANLLGFTFLLIGFVMYVDLKFFQVYNSAVSLFLSYLFIGLFFIYVVTFMYLFPVFVHYDLKIFQYIRQSFLILILRPLDSIMMIMGTVLVYYLMVFVPALIPIFGISLLSFVLMWITYRGFGRLEQQAKKIRSDG